MAKAREFLFRDAVGLVFETWVLTSRISASWIPALRPFASPTPASRASQGLWVVDRCFAGFWVVVFPVVSTWAPGDCSLGGDRTDRSYAS